MFELEGLLHSTPPLMRQIVVVVIRHRIDSIMDGEEMVSHQGQARKLTDTTTTLIPIEVATRVVDRTTFAAAARLQISTLVAIAIPTHTMAAVEMVE